MLRTQKPPVLLKGNSQIQEQGPLASLNAILDIGARRVLPAHLLRRSRVLATLRVSSTDFQQRIALTAQTGEESVLTWHLYRLQEGLNPDQTSIEKGRWVIGKIEREIEEQQKAGNRENEMHSNSNLLPSTPQPKSSPEAVIFAQLEALRRGDVYEASQFNAWKELSVATDTMGGLEIQADSSPPNSKKLSLGIQFELLRNTLRTDPYTALLNHSSVLLGSAALPTQHSMLQEVWVESVGGSAVRDWVRFVWSLSVEPSTGCWMCTQIEPYDLNT